MMTEERIAGFEAYMDVANMSVEHGVPLTPSDKMLRECLDEIKRLRGERRFPMQNGPSIPWSLAEAIHKGYTALRSGEQSLERIAARGGFSWNEVEIMYGVPQAKQAIDQSLQEAPQ